MPQVIAEGLKSGSVSLDNPHVRTLLESCAAAGIGTTGLNTKNLIKKSSGDGGRKSPSFAGGKKSPSPSGPKKAPLAQGGAGAGAAAVVVVDEDADGGGKKKAPNAGNPTANGDAGSERKGEGKASAAKAEAVKVGHRSPKASAVVKSPDSRAKRTPTKCVGKPGLKVPTTLYPELARVIDKGGGSWHIVVLSVVEGVSWSPMNRAIYINRVC